MRKILILVMLILSTSTVAFSNEYSACRDRALLWAYNNNISCSLSDLVFTSNCYEYQHETKCEKELDAAGKSALEYDYMVDCNISSITKDSAYNCTVNCAPPSCLYNCARSAIVAYQDKNSYIDPPTKHTGSQFYTRREGYKYLTNRINGTGYTGGLECSPCPNNGQCSNGVLTGCTDGYKMIDNACVATNCPVNANIGSCDNNDGIVTSCKDGYFIIYPGTLSSDCRICPTTGASFCKDSILECAATYYKPGENGLTCTKCPDYSDCLVGENKDKTGLITFNCLGDTTKNNSAGTCKCPNNATCDEFGIATCNAGFYLADTNICHPCRAGYFCDGTNNEEQPCPKGKTCPKGSSAPQDCPAGYYCSATGTLVLICLVEDTCDTEGQETDNRYCRNKCRIPTTCPAGNYCPANSESPTQCPGGYYCPNNGMAEPQICPAENYCPAGSLFPIPCAENEVCPEGSESPNPCDPGYYCTRTEAIQCPPGTTSDANSSRLAQCYISGGENGTRFCDKSGICFNLPNNTKISHK